MGEYAGMIADGGQCSWCGVCFEEEHGYPVACNSCWQDALKDQKNRKIKIIDGVQRATNKEF